jgi:predicted transcriptional regulator
MMADDSKREHPELSADIVAAYVSNNSVPVTSLPDLIAAVHSSLSNLGSPQPVTEAPRSPAVNPKKSIFPDYIISLEDGRKFKSMKRHLGLFGMTPDEYRQKWNLASDYPMVAMQLSGPHWQSRWDLVERLLLCKPPRLQ